MVKYVTFHVRWTSTLGFLIWDVVSKSRRAWCWGKSQRGPMLSAGSETTAEEGKRTLDSYIRGITRDGSRCINNSGSWHRAIRASLENVALHTFGIEFCHLRLSITRSSPLLTKQEGALETHTRKTWYWLCFLFHQQHYRALLWARAEGHSSEQDRLSPCPWEGAPYSSVQKTHPEQLIISGRESQRRAGCCGCRPPLCVWQRPV